MKLIRNVIIALVLVIACPIYLTLSQTKSNFTEDEKGLVKYKDGQVKKKTLTAEDWTNAEVNSPVNSGERVRTYKQSRAELELLELDVIRMAPETTIDIVKLYEETKGKIKETKIALQQGDLWANLEKKDASMKFDISTPVAGAAITGTVFRMNVNSDSTTELKVYTGEVKISNVPEAIGGAEQKSFGKPQEIPGPHEVHGPHQVTMEEWIYIIKNMQKIIIGGDGKVRTVSNFSKNDLDEQTDWVKWNLTRDFQEK